MKNTNLTLIQCVAIMAMVFHSGMSYGSSRVGYEVARKVAPKISYSPAVVSAYKAFGLPVGASPSKVVEVFDKIKEDSFSPYKFEDVELKKNLGKPKDWLEYSQDFQTIKQMNPEAFARAEQAFNTQRAYEAEQKVEAIRRQLAQEQQIRDQQTLKAQKKQQELLQQLENESKQLVDLTSSSSNPSAVDVSTVQVPQEFQAVTRAMNQGSPELVIDAMDRFSDSEVALFVTNNKQRLVQVFSTGLIKGSIMDTGLIFARSLKYHIFDSVEDCANALIKAAASVSPMYAKSVYSDIIISIFRFFGGDIKSFNNALDLYKILVRRGYITEQLVGDPVKRAIKNAVEHQVKRALLGAPVSYSVADVSQYLQKIHESLMVIQDCLHLNIISKSESLQLQENVQQVVQKIYNQVSKRSDNSGALSAIQRKELLERLEAFGAAPQSFGVQQLFVDLIQQGKFNEAADLWKSRTLELNTVGIQNAILDLIVSNLSNNDLQALDILKFGLTHGITFKQIISSPEFVSQVRKSPMHTFNCLFSACKTLQDYKLTTVLLENCEHREIITQEQKQKIASMLTEMMQSKVISLMVTLMVTNFASEQNSQFLAKATHAFKDIYPIIYWLHSRNLVEEDPALIDIFSSYDKLAAFNNKDVIAILAALVGIGWVTKEMVSSAISNRKDMSAAQKEKLNQEVLLAINAQLA